MSLLHQLWTWLLTPISGSAVHDIASAVSWHARLMVMAWAVLLPLGILFARFFKVMPQQNWPQRLDNKSWWHAHRALQSVGLLIMALGLYLILNHTGVSKQTTAVAPALIDWHASAGWLVVVIGALQALGGVFRGSKGGPTDQNLRGDHYDMTPYRRLFEWLHKSLGYAAVCLSVCVIVLGLLISDAPRWMPLILVAWWLSLVSVFVYLQSRGRCMDTYQAIWGDSLQHPGNRLKPAGWGARRYTALSFSKEFNVIKGQYDTQNK